MTTRNIVIVAGRCSQSRLGFGIRFERRVPNQWVATWSFAVKEGVAKREGYEKPQLDGSFALADDFPGCPHCSNRVFFRCGCGKLGCWDGETRIVVCPSCGNRGELSGEISSLEGGVDR